MRRAWALLQDNLAGDAGFYGAVGIVEDDLDRTEQARLVDHGRNIFDCSLLVAGLRRTVELELYRLAHLEPARLVRDDVGGHAAGADVGDFDDGFERLHAFAPVLGYGDDFAVERGDEILLLQLRARHAVFQRILGLAHLGGFPFGLRHAVVHLAFPELFGAHGIRSFVELLGYRPVLFVGLHLDPCRSDARGVFGAYLCDAGAELLLRLDQVHERVALVHERAFLDPDAVNLAGDGEADFCLVYRFRDAVERSRRGHPECKQEKCQENEFQKML